MSELEAFDRELAELEKITGIHIDEQPDTYSIFVATKWRTITHRWTAPEPFSLSLIDKMYLCSLGMYGWYELFSWMVQAARAGKQ